MWFIRPDEIRSHANPTPGVCIRTPEPRRYWFAGATPELAMILARTVLGSALDVPGITIDFGTRDDTTDEFQRERRLVGPEG